MMKKTIKKSFAVLLTLLTVVFIMPISSRAVTTDIPSDAVEFNGHYYKIYESKIPWKEAKQSCEDNGGYLVTITSKEENEFVKQIVADSGLNSIAYGGYYDADSDSWKWVTGERFDFTDWGPNEPNNNALHKEYFLEIYSDPNYTLKWNDCNENTLGGYICEWGKLDVVGEFYPVGYDFFRDSYSFENFSHTIDKEIFNRMFGKVKGLDLNDFWKKKRKQEGMCFGMAYTTAAIYNNVPYVSMFACVDGIKVKVATAIRDLNKGSLFNQGATIKIEDEYNDYMTIKEYISYAQLFQYTTEYLNNKEEVSASLLYDIVYNAVNNNQIGVYISMRNKEGGAHAVLAVGIDGRDIVVDDPNFANKKQRISIKENGEWNFSGLKKYNSDTCTLEYATNWNAVYYWIQHNFPSGTYKENADNIANFDSDKLLLTLSGSTYTVSDFYLTDIEGTVGDFYDAQTEETSNDNTNHKLFWVAETDSVTIDEIKDCNNEFRLAGNKNIIYVNTDEANSVTLKMNDESNESAAVISTDPGKKCSVACVLFDKGNTYDIKATGTSNSDTVTAAIIENGIKVTGLNDIEVSYVKNEEKVEDGDTIAEVKDGREVNITVDESKDTVKTDFVGEQTEDICGYCGKVHGTSFKEVLIKFFHRIFYFFVKLFGLKK
ncbi:MAG: C-type lectin domain-containing protein [Oscillospiraceae bacterium]|nr:C-type lectin domain-containing protein [Oscillospiraceae bacterium]